MTDSTEVRAVAQVLRDNREFLADTLSAFGDPTDPGYELDIQHVQALDQAQELLDTYASTLEA